MGVNHRRFQAGVTEQRLYHPNVITCLEQVSGERVPERMSSYLLGDFRLADSQVKRPLQLRFMQVIAPPLAGLLNSRQ